MMPEDSSHDGWAPQSHRHGHRERGPAGAMKDSAAPSGTTSRTETTYRHSLLLGRLWLFRVVSRTLQQDLSVSLPERGHRGREHTMSKTFLY